MKKLYIFLTTVCCFLLIFKSTFANEFSTRILVTSTEEATLSSEIAAKVLSIPVKTGNLFSESDPLIKFDCSFFEAQKDVVESELESARVTLKSNQDLVLMRAIGDYEVQLSQIAVEQAEAELKIAQLNTDRCVIRAPYDGRMSDIFVNEFESIERQQPLLKIIGSGSLEAKLMVSSKWLSWLTVGYPVQIVIDENGQSYQAKVSSIGANIDPISQTIDITAKFEENYDTLLSGMSGTATF